MRRVLLTTILAVSLLVGPFMASAARTDALWDYIQGGNYTKPNGSPAGTNILIFGTNKYINFNTVTGDSGYGFRDNAGVMEFKNSGGSWTAIGTGGGGGGGGGGAWATSTRNDLTYLTTQWTALIGATATTTNSRLEVVGSTTIRGNLNAFGTLTVPSIVSTSSATSSFGGPLTTGGSGTSTFSSGGITVAGIASSTRVIADNSTSTFRSLKLNGLDCSGRTNGGALTANASNEVVCSDDDGGVGGSQTPWTSNIAGAGFGLDDASYVNVTGSSTISQLTVGSTTVGIITATSTSASSTFSGLDLFNLRIRALGAGLLQTNANGYVGLAAAGTDYESPLTFSSPLQRTGNTVAINLGSLTVGTLTATNSLTANLATIGALTMGSFTSTSTASSSLTRLSISEFASSTQISVSRGFFQDGFTDCSSEVQTVLWNSSTGKFSCGSDATGGGGSGAAASTTANIIIYEANGTYYAYNASTTAVTSNTNFSTLLQANVNLLDNDSTGGIIFLLPGDYYVSATTTMQGNGTAYNAPGRGVAILGSGIGSTRIITRDNADFLDFDNVAVPRVGYMTIFLNGNSNGLVADSSLDGVRSMFMFSFGEMQFSATGTSNGWPINFGNVLRGHFSNLEFTNTQGCARFYAEGNWNPGDFTWNRSFCELEAIAGLATFEFATTTSAGYMNQVYFTMAEGIGTAANQTFVRGTALKFSDFRGLNAEQYDTLVDLYEQSDGNVFDFNYATHRSGIANLRGCRFWQAAGGNTCNFRFLENDANYTVLDDMNRESNNRNTFGGFIGASAGTASASSTGNTNYRDIRGYGTLDNNLAPNGIFGLFSFNFASTTFLSVSRGATTSDLAVTGSASTSALTVGGQSRFNAIAAGSLLSLNSSNILSATSSITAGAGTFGTLTASGTITAPGILVGSSTLGNITATGTITGNAANLTTITASGLITAPAALVGSSTFGTLTATGTITGNAINGTIGTFSNSASTTNLVVSRGATSSFLAVTDSASTSALTVGGNIQINSIAGNSILTLNGAGRVVASSSLTFPTLTVASFTATSGTSSVPNLLISTFASTTQLSVARGFFQDGLSDCTGAANKLVYTLASGKFGCDTDQTGGGGINTGSLTIGDLFATTSLTANRASIGSSTIGTLLASSTFAVQGTSSLNGVSATFLQLNGNLNLTASATMFAASTTNLTVSRFFQPGMVNCTTNATDKVLYNASTGQFSCGTDQTAAGGGVNAGLSNQAAYYASAGSTVSGTSTIEINPNETVEVQTSALAASTNATLNVAVNAAGQGMQVKTATLSDIAFSSFLSGGSFTNFSFLGDGTLGWGAGFASADTRLYRTASATLSLIGSGAMGTNDAKFGIGTTSPWATLSVVGSTSRPVFALATSSTAFPFFWAQNPNSSTTVSYNSTAISQIGINFPLNGTTTLRDHTYIGGRTYTLDLLAECEPTGVVSLSTNLDESNVCGPGFGLDVDTDFQLVGSQDPQMYPSLGYAVPYLSMQIATPIVGDTGALRTFGRTYSATTTPVLETMLVYFSATSSANYTRIGFENTTISTDYGSSPSHGCYFTASSSLINNWIAECRNGTGAGQTTWVNTGVATSTVLDGSSAPRTMRVEMSPSVVRFFIDKALVATITTNIPTTSLNAVISKAQILATSQTGLRLVYAKLWANAPWRR